MEKVCIVTVCRNALIDLKLTVASIKNQIYRNIYYIVVDGASSDGTQAYLEENKNIINACISEPDDGIYHAMNKAIDLCPPGTWVLFLNAGDELANEAVIQKVAEIFSSSVDFIFGDVSMQTSDGLHIYRTHPEESIRMPSCHQGMLVRSDLLKSHKFELTYKVGADMDFYLRATRNGRRANFYKGVICKIAPFGYSENNESVLQKDYYRSIKKHFGLFAAWMWIFRRRLSRNVICSRVYEKFRGDYFA